MPTTLLAVDDSATMRKVLEITFAGEDFRVVTAEGAEAALAKLKSENPALVLADATLPGTTGYQLAAQIKAQSPQTPVIVLASKQQPYDPGKGGAARVDDYAEKPFDTQQLIDKVKRLVGRDVPVASSRVSSPGFPAVPRPSSPGMPAVGAVRMPPASNVRRTTPGVAVPANVGTGTMPLTTEAAQARSAMAHSAPVAAPVSARGTGPSPVSPPVSVRSMTPAVASPAAALAATAALDGAGDLAGKLGQLGLSADQIAGVLALSREVVEKVVWEVVPVLAETLIKEEIKRLTTD